MPRPWDEATRQSKQLTIAAADKFKQSTTWGGAMLTAMVAEFNKLAAANKLGVTFVELAVGTETQSPALAKVVVDTAVTDYSYEFRGKTFRGKLEPPPSFTGMTEAIGSGSIEQAFIFLPAQMVTKAGSIDTGQRYDRMIGRSVRLAMALHEMLHACGLGQLDPGHIGRGDDLFYGTPTLDVNDPPDGKPGDRLKVEGNRYLPPFRLNAKTSKMIKELWE